ncbi:MAG TPA: N-acetylmuramoyl-L-alanine amidase, partial [Candidatus Ozemobacteraceae bacterium]|nr:N-acetylmuramoyl-L-alanine amidase [Candidatus Ozemobacteraceae bacterium]
YPDKQGTAEGRTGPAPEVVRASKLAAEKVHQALVQQLPPDLPDDGLKGDSQTFIGSKQGALTGSIFSEVPVVLVEMAVLSSPQDAKFIGSAEGQERVAKALSDGIISALKQISSR